MIEQDIHEELRNRFMGEIETEIVGMQCRKARIYPGEQVNLERGSKHTDDIWVENGLFEPVGHLPPKMASWLAPLIDSGQIYLEGYVPQASHETEEEASSCPVVLTVFQGERFRHLLEKTEPKNELESLHQTVLQAYENAQSCRNPESILGLVRGLRPLKKQELLPETRLLLVLLLRLAHEVRMSQEMRTAVESPVS